MKRWIVVLLLISSYCSRGQINDSASIKCNYKITIQVDSTKPSRIITNEFILLIGDSISYFYNYSAYKKDSIFRIHQLNGTMEEFFKDPSIKNTKDNVMPYTQYSIMMKNNTNQILMTGQLGTSDYKYYDELNDLQWVIKKDTLNTLGLRCFTAEALFRGRKYEAIFSTDIPVSFGPYKFKGLPGIILSVWDIKKNYIFECTGISKLTPKKEMLMNFENYQLTTRKKFLAAQKEVFLNPWQTLLSNSGTQISGPDAEKIKAMTQKSLPYNPIELE